jgi:hypothetical protein
VLLFRLANTKKKEEDIIPQEGILERSNLGEGQGEREVKVTLTRTTS